MTLHRLGSAAVTGHACWRHDDSLQREPQPVQLTKLGLLGGLLLTVDDRSDSSTRRFRKGALS